MKFNSYLECNEYLTSLESREQYIQFCIFDFILNKPIWKVEHTTLTI